MIGGMNLRSSEAWTKRLKTLVSAEDTGDGWARGAEVRETAAGPLVALALADVPCVRSADVIARHGDEAEPMAARPEQALPSTWRLSYQRPWGRITYGFRFAHADDFDNCLVEVTISRDGDPPTGSGS